MKEIYNKLDIPEPSSDLEERIIAAATNKSNIFPRVLTLAACLLIVFLVLNPEKEVQISKNDFLNDVEFFEEQYGFVEDFS